MLKFKCFHTSMSIGIIIIFSGSYVDTTSLVQPLRNVLETQDHSTLPVSLTLTSFLPPLPQWFLSPRCRNRGAGVSVGQSTTQSLISTFWLLVILIGCNSLCPLQREVSLISVTPEIIFTGVLSRLYLCM